MQKLDKKKLTAGRRLSKSAKIFLIVMLAYPLFEFTVSWIFVKFNSILMAFKLPTGEWSLLTFKQVFSEIFHPDNTSFSLAISIKNSFLWLLIDIIMLFFQFMLAYLFYRRIKGTRLFQIALYLPSILSTIVLTTVFKYFVMRTGPLGDVLKAFGVKEVPMFLQDPDYANKTVLFYKIWLGWGGHMLLLGGTLARVPLEVIESARLDGVGAIREMFQIIFPMVWSSLGTMIVLLFTGMFGVSQTLLTLTQGYYGTSTVGYWIFHRTYFDGPSAYNRVAAAGLLFTVIGLVITFTVRWLVEKTDTVEY